MAPRNLDQWPDFDSELTDVQMRVMSVIRTVKRGVFTLPEALEAYCVTMEEYERWKNLKPNIPDFLRDKFR